MVNSEYTNVKLYSVHAGEKKCLGGDLHNEYLDVCADHTAHIVLNVIAFGGGVHRRIVRAVEINTV